MTVVHTSMSSSDLMRERFWNLGSVAFISKQLELKIWYYSRDI
jgi:hypothetical protein